MAALFGTELSFWLEKSYFEKFRNAQILRGLDKLPRPAASVLLGEFAGGSKRPLGIQLVSFLLVIA
jgi:hypothetical protein